jgi:hypothetical protein
MNRHYRAKYALMSTNETALGVHRHFGSNARGSMSISQIACQPNNHQHDDDRANP